MIAPTNEQREAISRLQFTRDGKLFVEFMNQAIEESRNRLEQDETNSARLLQGESRTLRKLISLLTPVSQ